MQTTRLWTAGVFSTTTRLLLAGRPSSETTRPPSRRSRSLNPPSVQARATTFAPANGPISCSYRAISASTASAVISPFSIRSDSSALVRSATYGSCSGSDRHGSSLPHGSAPFQRGSRRTAPGSSPRGRSTPSSPARRSRPRAHDRRNGRCRPPADARPGRARWCPGRPRDHGRGGSCPASHERTAGAGCAPSDGRCG